MRMPSDLVHFSRPLGFNIHRTYERCLHTSSNVIPVYLPESVTYLSNACGCCCTCCHKGVRSSRKQSHKSARPNSVARPAMLSRSVPVLGLYFTCPPERA